ncbi:N-acetylglucosamine-6-phosphate deacetylase (EC [Olavius sp. associated proteobacterium Delta 1]|nr:N-acetylglucosamine-6-phosphate deacetylase (EC [Olavius sp. associated proteobacterium Delta 1]
MTVIKGRISGARIAEIHLDGDRITKVLTHQSNRSDQQGPSEDIRIAPGFIDIQVNGFSGIDFNQPDFQGDDLVDVCRNLIETGVTVFCPTLITADCNRLARNITEIRKACQNHPLIRSMVLGIHLEGPYINPEDGPRGAHPADHVLHPDWDEFERLFRLGQGLVRMVTVAPELPDGLAFIKKASQSGLVVGIGHCNPEPDIVDQAVRAGARISTHLGNGTHQMLDRHKNYLQKQLAHDGLMASIICDGPHLPDYFVKNVVRAKGRAKVILITDATAASHAPPGRYCFGDLEVEADDDGALRHSGTSYLAGSTLTMERAIENCANFAGIPLVSAINMATVNPARLFEGISGKLEKDQRADLVLFKTKRKQIRIERVYLAGRLLYSAEEVT